MLLETNRSDTRDECVKRLMKFENAWGILKIDPEKFINSMTSMANFSRSATNEEGSNCFAARVY